jgi:hypothetical protein
MAFEQVQRTMVAPSQREIKTGFRNIIETVFFMHHLHLWPWFRGKNW